MNSSRHNLFYHTSSNKGQKGVGFFVRDTLQKKVIRIKIAMEVKKKRYFFKRNQIYLYVSQTWISLNSETLSVECNVLMLNYLYIGK